jgi:ATPase family AAA domain-containing protein 2
VFAFFSTLGTGKTLTARALANSVSAGHGTGNRKVSFFMRKGADCLSKWVGEGERQLRLLFEQAKRFQPSIIFFDEIDGLAPVRSIKQDQIHASIVSTLLALMDGLDSRGQVIVIGATNRPDAIDPALRRPGRFDRELQFSLPDARARASILNIHTGTLSTTNNCWQPRVSSTISARITLCSRLMHCTLFEENYFPRDCVFGSLWGPGMQSSDPWEVQTP